MKNKAVAVAGIIFTLLTTLHLIRLLCPFEISVAGWAVPIWVSGFFFRAGWAAGRVAFPHGRVAEEPFRMKR